jgi:predicted transcriptional regulator
VFKKRDTLDVFADILKVCMNGAVKTNIVYKANLNFRIVKSHLDYLVEHGLLERGEGRYEVFKTADKGKQFLELYRQMKELL